MTAPAVPNATSPLAIVLIDPTTGLPYRIGSTPAATTMPIANINSPYAIVLVDPTTGVPYVS